MGNKAKSSGSAKRNRQGEGGGKPPFEPTHDDRVRVKALGAYGIPQTEIAKSIINPKTGQPISVDTLQAHFVVELAIGTAEVVFNVGNTLYQAAIGRPAEYDKRGRIIRAELRPDLNACQTFMRFRAGWKEPRIGAPGDGGDGAGQVVGVIYAPAPFAKL